MCIHAETPVPFSFPSLPTARVARYLDRIALQPKRVRGSERASLRARERVFVRACVRAFVSFVRACVLVCVYVVSE